MGITKKIKASGTKELFNYSVNEIKKAKNNTIVFTNFVDFDSVYGHRRDALGYASELELFDYHLPNMLSEIKNNDILIITADHGCDPTWSGTDHTRENIPILVYSRKMKPKFIGYRKTFADIGQSICQYFGLSKMKTGKSFF